MSVRPIEVQGAFPQSQKIGKLQDQLQQRSQVGQDLLAQQQKESEHRKRIQVKETEESDLARFNKDSEQKEQQNEKQSQQEQQEEEARQAIHPYKGKFVDLTS